MTAERESPAAGRPAGVELHFDIQRDLVCTANADGYFTFLNGAWERLLGWSRDELVAQPFLEFVHPEDRERTAATTGRVAETDFEIVGFENRYRTKDGGWRWLRWNATTDGATWFAVAYDVTEGKEAEERLRRALTEDRLLAYAQPIMDQHTKRFVQEELLARLRVGNGDESVLAADQFLPEAERHGLIGMIDRWMVGQAILYARGGKPAEVNLSARSIADESLALELVDAVRQAEVPAGCLTFEITETAAIENLDAARDFAQRLVRLGCRFALDDFGTGFGSLVHLRHLPVYLLKIDRSFVLGMTESTADQALVRGVVAIADRLGILTAGEGVENEETLAALHDCGVDLAQGNLIGEPRPLGHAGR